MPGGRGFLCRVYFSEDASAKICEDRRLARSDSGLRRLSLVFPWRTVFILMIDTSGWVTLRGGGCNRV